MGLCQPDSVPLHYSTRGTVLKNCFRWCYRKLWALLRDAMFSTTVGHDILWKKQDQNMTMLSSTHW